MAEIEVGEYVRTELGIIYKYTEDEKNDLQIRDFRLCNDGKIVKHSKQLIDLIEVGDIVNGHLLDEVRITSFGNLIFINDYKTELHEKDIEIILTKEEYLTRGYKAGGEDGI